MKWEKVRLVQVTEYITDGDHQPAPKSEIGISFIKIKDIQNNSISFDNSLFVPAEYYEKLPDNRKPRCNDTLITVVGSYGIPAFVRKNKKFCFERNIALLHPNELINPLFLYYSIKNPMFYKSVDNIANGSAQKLIPLSKLSNLLIPFPPKKLQNRIVNILSAYDDLIENNQRQIKLLEEAAQRLYKEWFVDLRFPGHEHTPIVDDVPEGWSRKKLIDISDIIMGQSPKSEFYNNDCNGLPFHQGVGSYGYRFVIDSVYSSQYTRTAPENSILFSVRAPVGRMNYTKNKVAIGRGLAAITSKSGFQSYLFYLLKEKFFKDDIIGNGSIFSSITKNELYDQEIIVPNIELARKYNIITTDIDKKIELLDTQISNLKEARDRLLPKLMSGEMEV